jgi:DNA-binding FrmR family transcriptional regulator
MHAADESVGLMWEVKMTVAEAHIHEELSEAKRDALRRLSYIEGHLAGIGRMVEEDKYCVDILKQTFAVRRAIQKLESVLLEGHLHSCVIDGVKDGREDQVLGELLELYALSDKR